MLISCLIRLNKGFPVNFLVAEFWLNSKRTWIKAEELFRKYLDWSYFPKKACLKDLSSACTDAKDAADLLFLSSRSGTGIVYCSTPLTLPRLSALFNSGQGKDNNFGFFVHISFL